MVFLDQRNIPNARFRFGSEVIQYSGPLIRPSKNVSGIIKILTSEVKDTESMLLMLVMYIDCAHRERN